MNAAEISATLGGAIRNGRGWRARCCCHEDPGPSLSLLDGDNGKLLVHCFGGCDFRDILAELRRRGWLDDRQRDCAPVRKALLRPKSAYCGTEGNSDFAAAIWRESFDPRGTLAEKYLNGRDLELADDLCWRVLRFHGHCPFGKDDSGKTIYVPALIIAFRPIRDDNDERKPPRAVHRVGLRPDGTKIGKKMLGPVGGCAVKIDPADMVEEGLGICEGVETALAIRATGWRPVWALGSAGAIERFPPLAGVEALTIFADNDESGRGIAAARTCAERWNDAGAETFLRMPHTTSADWADII